MTRINNISHHAPSFSRTSFIHYSTQKSELLKNTNKPIFPSSSLIVEMKPVDADILLHVHPNEKFHQLLIQRKFLWSLYPLKACWGPLRAHFPFIAQGIFRSISRPKEKYMGRWSYQKTIAVLAFRPLILEIKLFRCCLFSASHVQLSHLFIEPARLQSNECMLLRSGPGRCR